MLVLPHCHQEDEMQRVIMWLGVLLLTNVSIGFAQESDPLTKVRELRLRGALAEAQTLAEREMGLDPQNPHREIELRLELARIYDRIGLHQNTRPVVAALEQIDAAASVAERAGPLARAQIESARAEYHYRAEMSGREFSIASAHAHRAIELFQRLGDGHGEAEAVHRLGLIHLQRRELEQARALFDRSLELDRAAGERLFFRGDYERHVGFVYLLDGNASSSIPYFERSLAFRRESGAVDASLFAASTLASTLVNLGRVEEARPHLMYAMMVAERLDSPTGKARNGLVLGRLHVREGDGEAARIAFEMTFDIAKSIGSTSLASQAREAIERLEPQGER